MDWFATQLLKWHAQHGRKTLPWQQDITPYRVWVSEIMLQQTQVTTVIDYYHRFMTHFPTVPALASAPVDDVLHLWTGLGYYARGRNLHKAAQIIAEQHDGTLPNSQAELEALPGIGRSTAGAIRSIAMGQQAAILDGNVKRVLARFHTVPGYPGTTKVANRLWEFAETHTPAKQTGTYTQAIMDLGATVCVRKKPLCTVCPLVEQCEAHATNRVEAYPEPKPKKDKPTRSSKFFVVSTPGGEVFLERKPMQGLWGGLWTPPERPADTSTRTFLNEIGVPMEALTSEHSAQPFRHTFTHFHLDINPVFLSLATMPAKLEDTDDHGWYSIDEALGDPDTDATQANRRIGLSVPALKMLRSIRTRT